ncbi:FliM/FliN family flagellar motor switch protein [bacterium]|nr:FliM/FliN family flagellar motor switch protein [bacterium]
MPINREYRRSNRKNLDFDQLSDIKLPVNLELAGKKLTVRELLDLHEGSVLQLNRLAGENVDLMVNARSIAKGEVVITNNKFGFRLVSLLNPEERLKHI